MTPTRAGAGWAEHRQICRVRSARAWIALLFAVAAISPALPVAPASAGPNRWTSVGPAGGRVVSLAAAPASPLLYAATAEDLFYSGDGATTWERRSSGLEGQEVFRIVLDPANPTTAYAASFDGISKTTDAGLSWRPTEQGLGFASPQALAIAPSAPATLYLITSFGVYATTNGGAAWDRVSTSWPGGLVQGLTVDPTNPAVLYAADFEGVYKSSDGGVSWELANSGMAENTLVYDVAVDPASPSTLYAAVSGGPGVYKSTNGGASWGEVGAGLSSTTVQTVAVDPQSTQTIYAGTVFGLYRSTNGGADWSELDVGQEDGSIEAFAFGPGQSRYFGTYTAGVYRSRDGGTSWAPANSRLHATYIRAIAPGPPSPPLLYAAGLSGLFASADGGASWETLSSDGFFDQFAVSRQSPAVLYAGDSTGLRKSDDGGVSWDVVLSRYCSFPFCYSTPLSDLEIDPHDPATVYASYATTRRQGVYRSTTAGASWEKKAVGSDATYVYALAIDPQSPSTLYAGTQSGVYKSTNGADSWAPAGGTLGGAAVTSIAVAPSQPSTIYASDGSSLFRSTNAGAGWSPVALPGEAAARISALLIDPRSASTLYLGRSDGVYRTADAGASWERLGAGWPERTATALALRPGDPSTLLAGATNAGIYAYSIVAAPLISAQPGPQTVVKGGRAVLSVAATGAPPLSFQWFRGAAGDTSSPVEGATAASFTTPPLDANTSFWVRVANAPGATSDSAAAVVQVVTDFAVVAAAQVAPGRQIGVTVRARDSAGAIAAGYRGSVRLTSSDGQATLPPSYSFTSADGGVRSFEVTLRSPGQQTIAVADSVAASVRGSVSVRVAGVAGPTPTPTVPPTPGPAPEFRTHLPALRR